MADKKGEQKIKDVDYASLDDILKEIGEEGVPREKKVYIYRPIVTDENVQRPEIKSKMKDTSKVEKLGDFVPGGTEFDDYSGDDEEDDYSKSGKDFSEEEIEEELPEGHFLQPIEQDVEDKTVNEILSALDKRIKWEEVRQIDEKPRLEEDYGADVSKSKTDTKIPELEFKRPIKDKLIADKYNEDLTPKEEEVTVFDKYVDIMNEIEDVDIEKKEEKDAVESVDVVDFDSIDIEEEETEEEEIETNLDLKEEDILLEEKETEISDTSFDFDMVDEIEEKEEEDIKFDELDTSVLGNDNNVPIIDTGSFSMGSDDLEFSSDNIDEKNKKEESFDNIDVEEEEVEGSFDLDDISLDIPEDIKTDEIESIDLTPEKEVSTFTDSEGFSALDEESSLADLIPDEEGFSPEKEGSTVVEDEFESFTKEKEKIPEEEKTNDEFGFPDVDEESADEHLDDFSLNADILDEGTKLESDEEIFDGKEFSKGLDSSIPSDTLSYEEEEEIETKPARGTESSETIELSEEEFELVKKRLDELPEPTASEAKDIIINEKFNKNDMRKFIDILIKNKPYSEVQAFIDKRIGRKKARPKLPVGVYVILSIVLIGVIAYLSILLFTGIDPITSALNGVRAKEKIEEGLRILNTVPGEEGILEAEKLFEEAIKLNPNEPNYYLDYAEVYLKKNAPKNNELGNEIYTEYAYKKLMGDQTKP